MFLKYLEPIFKPYRMVRNAIVRVRTTKGNIKTEADRVKRFGSVAKGKAGQVKGQAKKAQGQAKKAQGQAKKVQGQAQQVQGQAQKMHGQVQGQMPQGQMPQAGGAPGAAPGALDPNPPIKTVGFFRRRKVCTQCNAELDKTWDSCPYCAQAAQQQQQPAAMKTQAFMVDGAGSTRQLLGWLVPVDGPQRGELYTLAPESVVGTDPTCNVVLADQYMSSHHAELKAEGGIWVLRDLGSTNGTYVNDQRIDQHELVDNDFIRFGQSVVKFKSL